RRDGGGARCGLGGRAHRLGCGGLRRGGAALLGSTRLRRGQDLPHLPGDGLGRLAAELDGRARRGVPGVVPCPAAGGDEPVAGGAGRPGGTPQAPTEHPPAVNSMTVLPSSRRTCGCVMVSPSSTSMSYSWTEESTVTSWTRRSPERRTRWPISQAAIGSTPSVAKTSVRSIGASCG